MNRILCFLCFLAFSAGSVHSTTTVWIDPGHGGHDPGKPGSNGLLEKDVNLSISLELRKWLNSDTLDNNGGGDTWNVLMTRETDVYVSLAARVMMANSMGADRFISIHANGVLDSTACGTETYCQDGLDSVHPSCILRNNLQNALVDVLALNDRGTKQSDYEVLRDTNMPGALTEVAFMSCPSDAEVLGSQGKRDEAALAHLYGLQDHYSVPRYIPNVLISSLETTNIAASEGWWRYFVLDLPDGVAIDRLTVETVGESGNADLYLKHETRPDDTDFDHRSVTTDSNEVVVVQNPATGTWHVGVFASTDYSELTIKVEIEGDFSEQFVDVLIFHWFYGYVTYVAQEGVVAGFAVPDSEDTVFLPGRNATRAETLKMAYQGMNRIPDVSCTEADKPCPDFPDVDHSNDEHWFWTYVFDAFKAGYIKGRICQDGIFGFCPDEPVTRYEAAKIIHAVFTNTDYSDSEQGIDGSCDDEFVPVFPDVKQNNFYCLAVQWMTDTTVIWNGEEPHPIVDGYKVPGRGNYFGGDNVDAQGNLLEVRNINRAEMAKIIANAMNHAGTGGNVLPLLSGTGLSSVSANSTSQIASSSQIVSLGKDYEQNIDPTNINAPEPFQLPGGDQQIITVPLPLNGATHDADGDELFYFWAATGGSFTTTDPDNFGNVTWIPPTVSSETTFIINVVNGDRRGKVGRARLELTVPGTATNAPPSGTITSPNGTQTGNVTVAASASDADGLARMSVTFVSGGPELELCGASTAACSGTTASLSRSNIDPNTFGANQGTVTLRLFVEDSTGDKQQVDTHSFTYDPPAPGPGFTLTVEKQGDGDGSVSGGGINCPVGCISDTATIPEDSSVTLTGAADGGSVFVGFAGERCYTRDPCTFAMNRDLQILASFGLPDSLSVLYTTPFSGDSNASPDGVVTLHFNREINPGSNMGSIVYREAGGPDVPFQAVISSTGSNPRQRLTLLPDQPLKRGASYMVNVPAGAVVDDFGEELAAPYGIGFTVAEDEFTALHAAVYPALVMEEDDTLLSIWLTQPTTTNRTIMIDSFPSGLLSHPSQVTLTAGDLLKELMVEAVRTPGNTSHTTATLMITDSEFGQVSVPVQIFNNTNIPGSSLRWQSSFVFNDDNGNGVFEAGEVADIRFDVANQGPSTVFNVILSFDILNSSNLRLLGGSGGQTCNLGSINPGQNDSCERTLLAKAELPTGNYYIEVAATSSVNGFLELARVPVVNNGLPDYTINTGPITSSEIQPGTQVELDVTAMNISDGFDLNLVPFEVVIEINGVEQTLYRTLANARGDDFPSQAFTLPVIAPTTPGAHPIRTQVNPQGADHIPESNTANNEAVERILRVAAPNQPPVLDPLPTRIGANVGEVVVITASASDPDNDPLSFRLGPGAPAGAVIGSSSGAFTWTPGCNQAGSHSIEIIVEDNRGGADSVFTSIDVNRRADLVLVKTADTALAVPGETISFELVVTNTGPSCATGVAVTDLLPATFENTSWTCTASAGSSCDPGQAGNISDTSVDLLAGGTATYNVNAKIADTAVGTVINSASVTALVGVIDPNPSNNQDSATVTLRDLDLGDAPDASVGAPWSYPTTLAENGARHGISNLVLGSLIESDPDGQPTFTANGDDIDDVDDEDGIRFLDPLVPCQTIGLEVTASAVGFLDAWLDFNTDGDWDDAGEQLFTSESLNAGTNSLAVNVPCAAVPGASFGRFRLSSTGGLSFDGLALDGEIEDHALQIEPIVHDITITPTGTGSGSVILVPGGVDCGSGCTRTFPEGTTITLTAQPGIDSAFTGWSGDCTGTGPCEITLNADKAVTAAFDLAFHSLTVTRAGTGSGTVQSAPVGIDCGADCSETYTQGTTVTLAAIPAAESTFLGWSGGGCSGAGTCTVTMTQELSVTANFGSTTMHSLTVAKTGTGDGTVTSSPAGIDCGSDCSESFLFGTTITLTATAGGDSTFVGWGGACSGLDTCEITMSNNLTVDAQFELSCLDNIETSPANWATRSGPADGGTSQSWSIVTTDSHSPTQSWFVADEAFVKDQVLLYPFAVPVSTADSQPLLQFWHRYDTDSGHDGGVLEYSIDGGLTWIDILEGDGATVPTNTERFLQGGYVTVLDPCCGNPLPGRGAWSGVSGGWINSLVDLGDLAGNTVVFRWRMVADDVVARTGWWVDDVQLMRFSEGCPDSSIFSDGLESGNTSAWSRTVQ